VVPGTSSSTLSTIARQAAQVSHSIPRSNGKRDCGSAGYGCAPVKRRRRPVTEGGVCDRFVGSLIALPYRQRVVPRLDLAHGTMPDDDHCDTKGT